MIFNVVKHPNIIKINKNVVNNNRSVLVNKIYFKDYVMTILKQLFQVMSFENNFLK